MALQNRFAPCDATSKDDYKKDERFHLKIMNKHNLRQLVGNWLPEGNYGALSLVTFRSALSQLKHLQACCQK